MSVTPTASSFSSRNLTSMQASAIAWLGANAVPGVPSQLSAVGCRCYAATAIEHNWSHNVLAMHIETGQNEHGGSAATTTDEAREQDVNQALVNAVAEYALGDTSYPMGTTEYVLTESLPAPLKTMLPSIEHIQLELQGDEA